MYHSDSAALARPARNFAARLRLAGTFYLADCLVDSCFFITKDPGMAGGLIGAYSEETSIVIPELRMTNWAAPRGL